MTFSGDSVVTIVTETNPTLTELLLMGSGSKKSGDGNIGQFGEGLKLAALALCRGRHGLIIRTPRGEITFSLRTARHLDEPTLHAVLDESKAIDSGCRISFTAAGIRQAYADNFLPEGKSEQYGPIAKEPGTRKCRVYCRGILVATIDDKSIYDWNLRDVKLNRDRDVVESFSLRCEIARILSRELDGDPLLADEIVNAPSCLEMRALETSYPSEAARMALKYAFHRRHGENAVLSTPGGNHNACAAAKGLEVVPASTEFSYLLETAGVKKSSDVVLKSDQLQAVGTEPYADALSELAELLDVIGVGAESFHVFADDGEHAGAYDRHGVWLNENLFAPGRRFERIRTMLHEMAHAKGGGDASIAFEHSLDFIAGKLGEALLNERVVRRNAQFSGDPAAA